MPSAPRGSGRQKPTQRPTSTPQLPCDEPGCGHWFRNLSGLTQHKRTFHPCFSHHPQNPPDRMESPNHFEPDDYPMSPVPEHAFDGLHQGDDPFGYEHEAMRAEYIDHGRKLYHNYHPSLDSKPVRFWNISANASLQHENAMNMASFYQMMLHPCRVHRKHQMTGHHIATEWSLSLPTSSSGSSKYLLKKSMWYLISGLRWSSNWGGNRHSLITRTSTVSSTTPVLAMSNGKASMLDSMVNSKMGILRLGCRTAMKFGIETHGKLFTTCSRARNLQMKWTMYHIRNAMHRMIRGAGKTSCLVIGPGSKRYVAHLVLL